MRTIRITKDMAVCTCGWYINTLTGASAAHHGHKHNVIDHSSDMEIIDERLHPNTERVTS